MFLYLLVGLLDLESDMYCNALGLGLAENNFASAGVFSWKISHPSYDDLTITATTEFVFKSKKAPPFFQSIL